MFKKIALILLSVLILFIAGVIIFIKTAPQFGAPPSGDHLNEISQSPNYGEKQFENLIETKLDYSFSNIIGMLKETMAAKNQSPKTAINTHFDQEKPILNDSNFNVTWYGHSAILLEVGQKRIFLDPMLGPHAAPVPFFGKRFPYTQPIDLENIGNLDAVVFSHDHYDHLDYTTIKAIHEKVAHFYVPLGLGSHLISWGVPADKITELDWWQEAKQGDSRFTATPARHFSGRGVGDNNKTLWASWVIETGGFKIYFSGDGGYGPHFKEIGEKFGPFDFAMMECGQYNMRWSSIHMMPEQTAQAGLDIKTKVMMPIHWGAFTLAPHEWIDPAERVTKVADSLGVKLITPEIGATFRFPENQPNNPWWRAFNPY